MRKIKTIKPKINIWLIIVLGIILVISLVYLLVKAERCSDEQCFLSNLKSCKKASYSSDEWLYKIKGNLGDNCLVYVKNLALKDAEKEIADRLKGKDMTCNIPKSDLGSYMPHENIDVCHGMLKEEILSIMIEKMHLYIIQHIGEFETPKVG